MEQLKKIGQIKPKKSIDIKKSRIGLGFEKLDRDIFDPEKSYPFVADSGIKWARLQSGWQRTEREKGVYDFSWLDSIVDKMISIGVEPWLCLCYGNDLYTPAAKTVFGAVGCPPINTAEEREAWTSYVKATVTHFKGRIHYYEVWNEPDGQWCWKHGPSADELADFTVATAKACKTADPECEVIGFVTCCAQPEFHKIMCEKGVCEHIDAISYHAYGGSDGSFKNIYKFYENIRQKYKPELKIIQGESGTQSRSDGCGALKGGAWTELKQAKFLLRHLIADLALGAEFTSYFSCMDMAEALRGTVGDIASISDFGYFGVVGAEFDGNARATGNYYAKPSYYALQNLTSILCEDYEKADIEVEVIKEHSQRMLGENFDFGAATRYFFRRPDGSTALFYWNPKNILTETYDGETSFKIKSEDVKRDVELIDMLDGSIYELDENHFMMEDGYYRFKNVPITDSPILIIFGGFNIDKEAE